MIILFDIEDAKGCRLSIPIAAEEYMTLITVLGLLRQRLGLRGEVAIDVRNADYSRVTNQQLQASVKSHDSGRMVFHCIVDAAVASLYEGLQDATGSKMATSSLKVIGGSGEIQGDVDKLLELNAEPDVNDGAPPLHFIKFDHGWKCYSRRSTEFEAEIIAEKPLLCVAYPTQLVSTVRGNAELMALTYDPNLSFPTTIPGVDDNEFARCLSIAQTHGVVVPTSDRFGSKVAMLPTLFKIPHSCAPTSFLTLDPKRQVGTLRCTKFVGLQEADEVTVTRYKVQSLFFWLLPTQRRQELLRELYHFTCACARCEGSLNPVAEATLSGAFFAPFVETKAMQKELTVAMRERFDAMKISVDFSSNVRRPVQLADDVGDVAKLFDFIEAYGSKDSRLRLHRNHWRMCYARLAFLSHATVMPIDRVMVDVALDQLLCEAELFPSGHPMSHLTYERFRGIVSRLPVGLAAKVQQRARKHEEINWQCLEKAAKQLL